MNFAKIPASSWSSAGDVQSGMMVIQRQDGRGKGMRGKGMCRQKCQVNEMPGF